MTEPPKRPDRIPLMFVVIFAIAWALVMLWFVSSEGMSSPSSSAQQRLPAAAPLAVVGAVICALGYLSMVKRRAMRRSQSSLNRLLEQRRQEKHL
jgi:flagellar basal body-associated protein FliL